MTESPVTFILSHENNIMHLQCSNFSNWIYPSGLLQHSPYQVIRLSFVHIYFPAMLHNHLKVSHSGGRVLLGHMGQSIYPCQWTAGKTSKWFQSLLLWPSSPSLKRANTINALNFTLYQNKWVYTMWGNTNPLIERK